MSIRPVFRVASAGLDPRDVRLIEIVFQHSQYNKYDFQMLEDLNLTRTDILLANPSDAAGLDALTAVAGFARPIPSVSAVPRGAQASARYSVTLDRLTLQLLPILNRVVEVERLEPAVVIEVSPLCEELTEIHSDDAAGEHSHQLVHSAAGEVGQAGAAALAAKVAKVAKAAKVAKVAIAVSREPAQAPGLAEIPTLEQQPDPVPPSLSGGQAMLKGATLAASQAAASAIAQAAQRAAADPFPGIERPAHHERWQGRADQAPARARLQALIADPSAAAQQQLARALSRIGLDVQCVASAADALQSLAARHIDLVVTESGLADVDGFELIRQMRSQTAYRYTPILLLRSRLHVMDATRARLAGDVTVLTKPLTRSALEAVVRQTLRNSVILDDLNELLSPG